MFPRNRNTPLYIYPGAKKQAHYEIKLDCVSPGAYIEDSHNPTGGEPMADIPTIPLPKYITHQGDDYLEIISSKTGMVLVTKYPDDDDRAEAEEMVQRLNE